MFLVSTALSTARQGRDGLRDETGLGQGAADPGAAIFVPQVLLETTLPPPPTGLPFNAIASQEDLEKSKTKIKINPTPSLFQNKGNGSKREDRTWTEKPQRWLRIDIIQQGR